MNRTIKMQILMPEILRYTLNVISQRRWFIIIPYCLSILTGLLIYVLFPRAHEATVFISVTYQGVPGNLVQTESPLFWTNRVYVISQRIMSRNILELVIEQNNLFPDQRYRNVTTATTLEMIESLRKKIKVEIAPDRPEKGLEAIAITYQDEDPLVARHVANQVAKTFIEHTQRVYISSPVGTGDSVDADIDLRPGNQLEAEQFKIIGLGMVPEKVNVSLQPSEPVS